MAAAVGKTLLQNKKPGWRSKDHSRKPAEAWSQDSRFSRKRETDRLGWPPEIRTIPTPIRIIGLDPGLRTTGWGIIETVGSQLSFVACGTVKSNGDDVIAVRLKTLHDGLHAVIAAHRPDEAAVEETFVNRDPQSALKLGLARGIALLVPALAGLSVADYSANLIKKTVTGNGHAEKTQVAMMVKILLPRADATSPDAADALAVAITHAQHRVALRRTAELAAR